MIQINLGYAFKGSFIDSFSFNFISNSDQKSLLQLRIIRKDGDQMLYINLLVFEYELVLVFLLEFVFIFLIFDQTLCQFLHNPINLFLNIIVIIFEQLRHIFVQKKNLFLSMIDFFVNDFNCLANIVSVLNLYSDHQFIIFSYLSQ